MNERRPVESFETEALFEVSGLGETCGLEFRTEPAIGIEGYLSIIDAQLEQLRCDAEFYAVDMRPEKYGARADAVHVELQPGPSDLRTLFCERKTPQSARHGKNWLARLQSRNPGRQFALKNRAYGYGRSLLYRLYSLYRHVPYFRRTLLRCQQTRAPALSTAIEGTSMILTDSLSWLLRRFAHINHIPVRVTLRERIECDTTSMPLARCRPMALRHFALHECERAPQNDDRLFVLRAGDSADTTIEALEGNLSAGDKLLVLGAPSRYLSRFRDGLHIAPAEWLYADLPETFTRAYLPAEPAGGWPRITVVTVSYNQADFIEDCLKSILDQGYPNLEHITVDGGSTDGTVEILERYRERITHLIIEPDEGQSDALNKGFRLATGDIMTWVCSDDMLAPNALFHIGHAFATNKVDIVCGGCRVIDEVGRLNVLHHSSLPLNHVERLSFGDLLDFLRNWQAGHFFFQPEVFFSREIWQRSGAFLREHLYYAMDYDLFLRMAMAGASILHISRTIGVSRQHSAQKTQHGTMEYLPQIHGIISDYKAINEAVREAITRQASPTSD